MLPKALKNTASNSSMHLSFELLKKKIGRRRKKMISITTVVGVAVAAMAAKWVMIRRTFRDLDGLAMPCGNPLHLVW